jgi:hypothetical protein
VWILGFKSDRRRFFICFRSRMLRPVTVARVRWVWRCPHQNGPAWPPRHMTRRRTYRSSAHTLSTRVRRDLMPFLTYQGVDIAVGTVGTARSRATRITHRRVACASSIESNLRALHTRLNRVHTIVRTHTPSHTSSDPSCSAPISVINRLPWCTHNILHV